MSLNLPRNWRRDSRRMLAPALIALLALLLVFAAACEREGDEEDTRNDNGGFTESVGDQSEDDESADEDGDTDADDDTYGEEISDSNLEGSGIEIGCDVESADELDSAASRLLDLVESSASRADDDGSEPAAFECVRAFALDVLDCVAAESARSCVQKEESAMVACLGADPAKVAITGPVMKALQRTRPTGKDLTRLRDAVRNSTSMEELLAVYEAVAVE